MSSTHLLRNTNQALGLAHYAKEFMKNGKPSTKILKRTKLFHTDSVICGISALALKTRAPNLLREEAVSIFEPAIEETNRKARLNKVRMFGGNAFSIDYKSIAANCSAVREWDSNGTVFGYRSNDKTKQAGEFGHNDFYPVVIAAAAFNPDIDGKVALKAMLLLDEIRGRLAESFSLKTYYIDHVVHGAIASIVTYGTLLEATPEQIESAIGMFVAHYIPFRAIRAGHQLSDSKGASAAISTEVAIMSLRRAMRGFQGPKDIFRNPQAIFRLFPGIKEHESSFDLELGNEGMDFAVRGMHFKLGLYEHQSAGAIQGVIDLLKNNDFTFSSSPNEIDKIVITTYEPAFSIIGDVHKRNPTTRQSADHSMVYIISTLLRKAYEHQQSKAKDSGLFSENDQAWKDLVLLPEDYCLKAINDPVTRQLIDKIEFKHGGEVYDKKYPEGIPTKLEIKMKNNKVLDSGLIMFPSGHAKNKTANLEEILENKFMKLGKDRIENYDVFIEKLKTFDRRGNKPTSDLYKCQINFAKDSIDE